MSKTNGLIDLGEISSHGVGGRNEDWWSLLFNPSTGELLIFHSWSYMSGLQVTSGEDIKPLRDIDRQDWLFKAAVEYIQQLANRKN
jgi:hypothetical protein